MSATASTAQAIVVDRSPTTAAVARTPSTPTIAVVVAASAPQPRRLAVTAATAVTAAAIPSTQGAGPSRRYEAARRGRIVRRASRAPCACHRRSAHAAAVA